MCNEERNNRDKSCIGEILQIIVTLQSNACPENCLDSCDRPALGGSECCIVCNTRPIMLYLCGCCNTPVSMPTTKTNTTCTNDATTYSNVFRCEKVDDNCATCRVLAPNLDTTSTHPYVATDSFFTVDLSCCCIIRCLNDTYVECV